MVERIYSHRGGSDPTKKRRAPRGAGLRWIADHIDYESSQCLIWPFGRGSDGYGILWKDGAQSKAHRVMCEAVNGPSPRGRPVVAHSCGNGGLGCVAPKHLRWASYQENSADTKSHFRTTIGQKSKSSKLTVEDVEAILFMAETEKRSDIAKLFGVSDSNIAHILTGRTWSDVARPAPLAG